MPPSCVLSSPGAYQLHLIPQATTQPTYASVLHPLHLNFKCNIQTMAITTHTMPQTHVIYQFNVLTNTSCNQSTTHTLHDLENLENTYTPTRDLPSVSPVQRVRDPTLPACRTPPPEPLPSRVLRDRHLLHGGLRRFRARHLAVAALYGHHDLRGAHRSPHTGETHLRLSPSRPIITLLT